MKEATMTEILYTGRVFALHAQVALFDAEDDNSYPQWETGTEEAIFGPKGVAVATAADRDVEVTVQRGAKPDGMPRISGEIEVGNQGLIVGNIVSGDFAQLEWSPGKVTVDVYTDKLPSEQVAHVVFVLS
jgi:hypothetical protein